MKEQLAGPVINRHRRLIAALLLRHRQVVSLAHPGGVVAQASLSAHGAENARPVQNIKGISAGITHRRLLISHRQHRGGQAHREIVNHRSVILKKLDAVRRHHQQVLPQHGVAVGLVGGVGIEIGRLAAAAVHKPAAQRGKVAAVLHGGEHHHRQHCRQHQKKRQPTAKARLLPLLFPGFLLPLCISLRGGRQSGFFLFPAIH